MTRIDRVSYLIHDSRWWLNQYWDWFNTFPRSAPIATYGYNTTGLAINTFYPNTTLKILEIPLILLHIENPYIVMGILTILCNMILGLCLYLNVKVLSIQKPILVTTALVLLQNIPLNGGLTNSLPQQLGNAFIYLGVYAIISKRYEYMIISTILLLHTSFTTSIIAGVVYAIVLIVSHSSFQDWLEVLFNGIIGVSASMPMLISVFKNISHVAKPTFNFNLAKTPWFISGYLNHPDPTTIIAFSARIIGPLLVIILIYITYTKYTSKVIPVILLSITLISASPKISAAMTIPIQVGTWPRVWPIVVTLALIAISNMDTTRYYKYIIGFSIILLGLMSSNLNLISFNNLKDTNYVKAYKTKNWNDVYGYVLTNLHLVYTSNQTLIYSSPDNMGPISPDYIPSKASIKDNILAYETPSYWKSKYGLEKHAIDKGRKLKITIDPKHNVTPLGVWHYDFLKYNVSSTNGKVVASNHDMFEYHGTKKTTIYISLK